VRRGSGHFKVPAAPDTTGYTKAALPPQTASTDTALGEAQRFRKGKDISATWWQLFHSHALNSLIEKSLEADPNLQSALAALRVAKLNVFAQEGHYFPPFRPTTTPPARGQLLKLFRSSATAKILSTFSPRR
jgi:outer membrane protein TolC